MFPHGAQCHLGKVVMFTQMGKADLLCAQRNDLCQCFGALQVGQMSFSSGELAFLSKSTANVV